MPEPYTANDLLNAIAVASKTLSERKDEINRLNVFPVPDGDTGTNMSLTLETVVENLANLPIGAAGAEIRKAITTGALMGARGNSGVITSQILRGLCEGSVGHDELNADSIDAAFAKSQEVAFQAVRKPVEGTILTVLRDSAAAAKHARKKKMGCDEALAYVVEEAYASVQRTPDLLPVLKENGVVDAGGFGLAIFFDAFVSALLGKEGPMVDELAFARGTAPKVEIEQINDWEGSAYRYCTEFLVHSDTVDVDAAKDFLPTMGDCDLMVGMHPNFKVHVHSNRPDQVLGWFLTHDAQISEVHIHNMQQQSAARTDALAAEQGEAPKPLGFVAVAAGEGNAKILKSLGVDVVVSGGQTMNPSTKDLLDAAGQVNADAVIILPNNKNIIMAAEQTVPLATDREVIVIPTRTIPQGLSAMLAFDPDSDAETNQEAMLEAAGNVDTGLVTFAARDSEYGGHTIRHGDILGLKNGKLEYIEKDPVSACVRVARSFANKHTSFITLIYGEGITQEQAEEAKRTLESKLHSDVEITLVNGGQPVYFFIISVE